jgi:hypothetical protein
MPALRIFLAVALSGCSGFLIHQASGPTADILVRAQASLQMESDYELAAQAIPGALKTIEGFYVADSSRDELRGLLAEGYCQYATAFVEDDWEVAKFAKQLDRAEELDGRATKMFARCMNYALADFDASFQKAIFGTPDQAKKAIDAVGLDHRTSLLWVAAGLGGMVNHNLGRAEMVAYLPVVTEMLDHVVEIDKAHPPKHCDASCTVHLALPHIALGMVYSAASKQFGGDSARATQEFDEATSITGGKMLLPAVLLAYRVGLQTNDRKLFHSQLAKVLETDPAIWPEQRLANEVAHRKARRYLSHEKDLFQ